MNLWIVKIKYPLHTVMCIFFYLTHFTQSIFTISVKTLVNLTFYSLEIPLSKCQLYDHQMDNYNYFMYLFPHDRSAAFHSI